MEKKKNLEKEEKKIRGIFFDTKNLKKEDVFTCVKSKSKVKIKKLKKKYISQKNNNDIMIGLSSQW